jgi:hypothetical protein
MIEDCRRARQPPEAIFMLTFTYLFCLDVVLICRAYPNPILLICRSCMFCLYVVLTCLAYMSCLLVCLAVTYMLCLQCRACICTYMLCLHMSLLICFACICRACSWLLQEAFRRAGQPLEAIRMLTRLSESAVTAHQFADASHLYWMLAVEHICLAYMSCLYVLLICPTSIRCWR